MSFFLFCIISIVGVIAQKIPQPEIDALNTFYKNFNGEKWKDNTNWGVDKALCQGSGWFGVDCTADNFGVLHIYEFNMPTNNVSGTFHTFTLWNEWPYLKNLFLPQNQITGSIPELFYMINASANIQQIHFTGNLLTGTISPLIGNFKTLEQLLLGDNTFYGNIPGELFELTNLNRLELENNNYFSGPLKINSVNTKLTYLDFGNNELTGTIPSLLYSLTGLQYLMLSAHPQYPKRYGFSGTLSSDIANLTSLTILDLSNHQLVGSIPDSITNLVKLQQISLENNNLIGVIPNNIDRLNSLTKLSLGLNKLSGIIPSGIYQCKYLNLIDLGGNRISGTISTSISNLNLLSTLIMKGTPDSLKNEVLTGSIPEQIWYLTQLQFLFLSFNQLNGEIPPHINTTLKYIDTLSLESNLIGGSIPSSLYYLTLLKHLLLQQNKISGSLSNDLYKLPLESFDVHSNMLQGFVPNYFNESHNFPQIKGTILLQNSFLCPITYNARTLYGASCNNIQISSIEPYAIFREQQSSINIKGFYLPGSLKDTLTCVIGKNNNTISTNVILGDSRQIVCNSTINSFVGLQDISLHLDGKMIAQKSNAVLYYGRPVLTSITPTVSREQGGIYISIYGSGFIQTGKQNCLFNGTSTGMTIFNETYGECLAPRIQNTILYNTTINVRIGLDDINYSNNSMHLQYYPWCEGFPPCGGDAKGKCIQTPQGEHPYCNCSTIGFDTKQYCFDCLPNHYGVKCAVCPDCHDGTCNAGYSNDGLCSCDFGYAGNDCTFFWGLWIGVPVAGVIVVIFVVTILYKNCREKNEYESIN